MDAANWKLSQADRRRINRPLSASKIQSSLPERASGILVFNSQI